MLALRRAVLGVGSEKKGFHLFLTGAWVVRSSSVFSVRWAGIVVRSWCQKSLFRCLLDVLLVMERISPLRFALRERLCR